MKPPAVPVPQPVPLPPASPMRRIAAALACAGLSAGATAQSALFKDADLTLGERLIAEHRCSDCHARRVGGDGHAIYRPQGRINSPSALRSMVQYCSTQLNLPMFPEDVDAISAVLDRDHYHFR